MKIDRTVKPTRLASTIMVIFCLAAGALRAEPGEAAVTSRVMQAADKDKDRKLSLAEFLPLDVQARRWVGRISALLLAAFALWQWAGLW